jgi:hypothetical protein
VPSLTTSMSLLEGELVSENPYSSPAPISPSFIILLFPFVLSTPFSSSPSLLLLFTLPLFVSSPTCAPCRLCSSPTSIYSLSPAVSTEDVALLSPPLPSQRRGTNPLSPSTKRAALHCCRSHQSHTPLHNSRLALIRYLTKPSAADAVTHHTQHSVHLRRTRTLHRSLRSTCTGILHGCTGRSRQIPYTIASAAVTL